MNIVSPEFLITDYNSVIEQELSSLYEPYKEDIDKVVDKERLDWELCSRGLLSEKDILSAYAKATELPVVSTDDINDLVMLKNISADYARSNCCLPLIKEVKEEEPKDGDDSITMLISDPYHVEQMIYLFAKLHNKNLKFSLMRRSSLDQLISEYYSQEEKETVSTDLGNSEEALKNMASEAKIVRFVNEIFSRAIELDVSDIHIEPEENNLAIRFRIDGILHDSMHATISQYPAIASRIKLIGGLNIAETRLPQDGRTDIQLGKHSIDIRISTIPTMNGESIVMRLLRNDVMEFNLENVGMASDMREEFEKLVKIPHGIVLVVGPTGSGKTTTLYSVMGMLNSPDKKIITIEDPVEYRQDRLSQIQVNPKIGMDFASGLRHIVRQDPDIILVGEIRDRETAEIAINAALTGHLVLSTLHTNDAAGAVSRLLDMGIDGFLISSALAGVLSQRLVRKSCDSCNDESLKNKKGQCAKCADSGFKGRLGIFELMKINDKISNAISNNKDSHIIKSLAIENGMVPLHDDGIKKFKAGLTTEAEIRRVTSNI